MALSGGASPCLHNPLQQRRYTLSARNTASAPNLRHAAAVIASAGLPAPLRGPVSRGRAAHWPRSPSLVVSASAASASALSPSSPQPPTASPAAPAPAAPPFNPFLRVLVPTSLALMLCNMDRICLSIAIMPMAAEFGWPASLQGVIQSAFLWGYMATQLAGGSLADRLGGRRVLAGGIAWFSVASLLLPLGLSGATTAAGLTVPVVLASRFLTGLGEGVALPSMSNLVACHIPPAAKARALGFCFSGFHSGNLAGLILSPLLLMSHGWRGLFYVFGALGLPLLLYWLKTVPEAPPPPPAPHASSPATAAPTASTTSTSTSISGSDAGKAGRAEFHGPAPGAPGAAVATWGPPTPPLAAEAAAVTSSGGGGGGGKPGQARFHADGPGAAATAASASWSAAPTAAAGSSSAGPEPGTGGTAGSKDMSQGGGGGSGGGVTVGSLLSSTATWAIIVVNIVNHFGYFIYLNWMPTYFNKALGFDLRSSSFTAFLPWLVMAVGSSASGLLADSLVARGVAVTRVRKTLQTVAFLVPAAALVLLAQPGLSPRAAVACMTVALGTTSLGQAGFVANMSDIAPRHAGKMFGLCNTFGCLAGIVGVTAVGFIVEATRSFAPVFSLTAALYVVAAVVWNLFCTGEVVFE